MAIFLVISSIYINREWDNEVNLYNNLLICLILIKGLHDFTQLSQIMKDDLWETKNEMIESIWDKKCDCKDRVEFISNLCKHQIIGDVLGRMVLTILFRMKNKVSKKDKLSYLPQINWHINLIAILVQLVNKRYLKQLAI